jgi:hypothetical protein
MSATSNEPSPHVREAIRRLRDDGLIQMSLVKQYCYSIGKRLRSIPHEQAKDAIEGLKGQAIANRRVPELVDYVEMMESLINGWERWPGRPDDM